MIAPLENPLVKYPLARESCAVQPQQSSQLLASSLSFQCSSTASIKYGKSVHEMTITVRETYLASELNCSLHVFFLGDLSIDIGDDSFHWGRWAVCFAVVVSFRCVRIQGRRVLPAERLSDVW